MSEIHAVFDNGGMLAEEVTGYGTLSSMVVHVKLQAQSTQ
jgi:hypothetical protein